MENVKSSAKAYPTNERDITPETIPQSVRHAILAVLFGSRFGCFLLKVYAQTYSYCIENIYLPYILVLARIPVLNMYISSFRIQYSTYHNKAGILMRAHY